MSHSSRRDFLRTTAWSAAALAGLSCAGLPALAASELAAKTEPDAKPGNAGPSKKKGVCGGTHAPNGLLALKVAWFYTWGSTLNQQPPKGVEWIPQIFPHTKEDIQASCQRIKKQGFRTLLGYNEPDHPHQGNITVEKAVENWPFLEDTGAKLISPAVTWAPNKWMKDFMAAAKEKKFRIDAVGIHWYGAPHAEAFMKYVEAAHKDYDKPIWITEFAVQERKKGAPSKITAAEVLKFQQAVLPELEKLDWIERYCWYNPHKLASENTGFSCLLDDSGGLTELGRYFAAL